MRRVPTPEELQAVLSLPQFSARAWALEMLMEATEAFSLPPHPRALAFWERPSREQAEAEVRLGHRICIEALNSPCDFS